MTQTNIPRPEYPRPDFERKQWQSLNGAWEFSFDEPTYDKTIRVPFCYQSKASGIGLEEVHPVVFYRRGFSVAGGKPAAGRLLLHFGAVDYVARVWLNGAYLGTHRGGYTPFHFDITETVAEQNELVVQVTDHDSRSQPRGKQSWTGESFRCWYTPTTGIWQSVWLEYAGDVYLRRCKVTPNAAALTAQCEVFLSDEAERTVELRASITGKQGTEQLGACVVHAKKGYGKAVFAFEDLDICRNRLLWSPKFPNLIDLEIIVRNDGADDVVHSYFGLRDFAALSNRILLNGDNCYQRLILDQGYWPESLLTPPSDQAIVDDIQLTKRMGFNGARKHQKIEDPRYYYWADKLGLLVWGEMPSCYSFDDDAVSHTLEELTGFLERDFNHPCIVTWVPVNESWGVRSTLTQLQQQDYTRALYYLLKALDPTRPVSSNDGWEQTEATDLCAIHDYALFPENTDKYTPVEEILEGTAEKRLVFADGCHYSGQPILMTEYGGIRFEDDDREGWGYYDSVPDADAFLSRLRPVTEFLRYGGVFAGFCYTQLTDVMQEQNGLLTEEREAKIPIEQLYAVFGDAEEDKEEEP